MNFEQLTSCRLCSSNSLVSVLKLDGMPSRAQYFPMTAFEAKALVTSLNLTQCAQCGLVQILGKPVDYYREVIRSNHVSGQMRAFRIQQIGDFIRKFNLQSSLILEVGCGNGDILEILRELGCNFHGMEFNQSFLHNLQKKDYVVFPGYPGHTHDFPRDYSYDSFLSFNVLEHAPNTKHFLIEMQKMMSPDAVGIVEVPNFDMIISKNMISEFMLDHLTYFDKRTFRLALESSGFEVLEMKEILNSYVLSAVVKIRPILDFRESVENWTILKKDLNRIFRSYSKNEICIWGAGHQSLAAISLLELQKHVEYIIDSANNKQGLYSPASGIKIVSPAKLKSSDSIRCVIVIGGSYNEEISADLLENYSKVLRIFTIDGCRLREIT